MPEPRAISLTQGSPVVSARSFLVPSPLAQPAPAGSLYIHVPFCFHKCHYCDFYSIVDTRDRQAPFTDRLIRELRAQAPLARGAPLRTIFVGGGTPSLLRPELWQRLLAALHELFDLSLMHASTQGEGEFTVECNPETVTPELMTILRSGGVNRVSIGAQTFNPVHLKTLERWHDPDNVPKALDLARAAGIARQSIDLIYAIPGQSLADLERDLAHALSLGTTHLSAYSLTYEPNTAMTARKNRGEFAPVDEDLDADMAQLVLTKLRAAGLDRYEISNFAVPGAESRHNLAYWRQEPWLACGPSASGHFAGHRWKNLPRLDDYLAFDDEGFTAARDHEPPDPRRALSERVMTGLRLREGLPLSEIEPAARALGLWPALERAAQRLASRGQLLVDSGERWRLTDEAMMLADGLALELMSALDPA